MDRACFICVIDYRYLKTKSTYKCYFLFSLQLTCLGSWNRLLVSIQLIVN